MPLSSGEYCLHQDRWCPPTSVHGGTIQKDKCKSSIVNSLFCTNGLLLYTYRPCMYKWPAAVHISHDRQDSLFLLTLVPTQVTRMEETNNAYTISIGIRKKCKRRVQKVVASSVVPFIRCRPCTEWLALVSRTQDGFPRQILWSERETNDVV